MLAGFLSHTEDQEEHESTRDDHPFVGFLAALEGNELGCPDFNGVLPDAAKVEVEITETLPRIDTALSQGGNNIVDGEGDRGDDFETSHSHKTEVPVEGKRAIGLQQLAELLSAFQERSEGDTCQNPIS